MSQTTTALTERTAESASDRYIGLVQQLASKVATGGQDSSCQAIGVTSCVSGEGVTTVVANLAEAATRCSGGRVLVVDTNLHKPELGRKFGIKPEKGLVERATGAATLNECIYPTNSANLSLLGVGTSQATPGKLYDPTANSELVTSLKRDFSIVLFDLPPVSETAAIPMIHALDGILLVVEAERLRHEVVTRAKKQLLSQNANLIGVVLNKRRMHVPGWIYDRI